jgi:membrane protease subunit HflC
VYYDRRLLDYDLPAFEVTAGDQKRLVVDTFTRYRIVDALRFYKTVNNEAGAQRRLGALIPGLLRSVLGSVPLVKLLSAERAVIMKTIRDQVNEAVKELGIEVVDFRILRADLPSQNSEAIFARMISDRQREAKEFRAKGVEAAQLIKARAEKERLIALSEARRTSQIIRGEGDAKAAQLYAQAHGKDPQFYSFWQAMKTYRQTFGQNNDTVFILSPDQKFFRHWTEPK